MALRDSDSAIRDRQLDCHLHLIRHVTSLVLKNANQHPSLFPTRELWVNGSNSANLFNGFGWTEADTDSCTPKMGPRMDCHLHLIRHMTSLVLKNANQHPSLFPTRELWVNGSNTANLFNGFGWTEVDTDSCTPKWDREWTVTCTWNDMWRCWYREMLISTNHCLRFENFQVKVSVSAQMFNGFGWAEADRQLAPRIGTDKWTVTCTSD